MKEKNEKIKIILILVFVFIVGLIIFFIYYEQPSIELDEMVIDISQFPVYKNLQIEWIAGERSYNPIGYGEISIIREAWDLKSDVLNPSRIFQYTLLYQNKFKAALAFYLYSPNMRYKDEWPNYYNKSWNLSKETKLNLNADRYIFYCGIGNKESCQVWNYWAQYENSLVLFGLYSISDGNSIEEYEKFIYILDSHVSEVIEK